MFLVDADKIHNIAVELGVTATPAVLVFFRGNPIRIRRYGWEEDTKYVGCVSQSQLQGLLEAARNSSGMFIECE